MNVFSITVIVFALAVLALLAIFIILLARSKATEEKKTRSVTRFLFFTTQIAAMGWVSISYLIAGYATIYLGQPFPVVELSQQVIITILGVNVLKVVENIFEHNDGKVLGTSNNSNNKPV